MNNIPLVPIQRIKLREAQPYVASRTPFTVSHYLHGRWVRTLDLRQCHYVVYFANEVPMFVYDDKAAVWFVNDGTHGKMWLRIKNAIWPQIAVDTTIPSFDTRTLERIIAWGYASLTRKRLGIASPKQPYTNWQENLRQLLIDKGHITPWHTRKGNTDE